MTFWRRQLHLLQCEGTSLRVGFAAALRAGALAMAPQKSRQAKKNAGALVHSFTRRNTRMSIKAGLSSFWSQSQSFPFLQLRGLSPRLAGGTCFETRGKVARRVSKQSKPGRPLRRTRHSRDGFWCRASASVAPICRSETMPRRHWRSSSRFSSGGTLGRNMTLIRGSA